MGLFGRRKPQRRRVSIELEEYDWGKYTSGGVVVGESHHADDLAAIMASVRYVAAEHRRVSVCTTARLARDRGNEHDPNAVAVTVAEPPVVVGYINRKDAAAVAEAVEAPVQIRARLTKFRDGKFSVALDLAAWQALRGHEPGAHELAEPAASLGRSFAAIDLETANSERDSACAVGVVVFEQGSPTDTLRLLIQPPGNRYDAFNTEIHGIGPSDTRRSPGFPEVWEQVAAVLDGRLVVAHNAAFDLSVLRRSAERHGYAPEPFQFACTYRIARSAMPDAASWSLDVLADDFGIPLAHHDPLSDARAAGLLWLALSERFGATHTDLLARLGYRLGYCHPDDYRPFSNATVSSSGPSKPFSAKDFTPNGEPDPEGLLFSKRIVFTGTLQSMPRREAFQAAVDAGARPSQSVSRRTNYLVVGATDLRKVGETGRSSKHRKSLDLAAEGSPVEIIDEDQFICMLADTARPLRSSGRAQPQRSTSVSKPQRRRSNDSKEREPDADELPRRAPIRTRSSYDDVDEAVLAALAPKVPKAYCSAYRPDGDDEQREREGEDWERSKTLDGRLVATGHRLKRQALAVECRGQAVAYVMPVAMKLDPAASDGTPVKVKITASGWCSYDGEPHTPGSSSLVDDDTAEEVCTRDFRVAVWKA